ncbi:hypothetical protein Hanom_Chr11g00977341 [Helianthus anomalus]
MELTSRIKMTRFQTFWIQMQKNKPLDESRKNSQGRKCHFTLMKRLVRRNHHNTHLLNIRHTNIILRLIYYNYQAVGK